jgi:hypothetical protein
MSGLAGVHPAPPSTLASGHWHRRVVRTADVAGLLVVLTPALLVAHALTGVRILEVAMYVIAAAAVVPCLGPFTGSLRRNQASLLFVLLFGALTVSTLAAFIVEPSFAVVQRLKALAATAVWASIYVIVLLGAQTPGGVRRLVFWIDAVAVALSVSVCVGALLHLAGIRFGEIIVQGDGSFRAFGPLGDQVAFVVVLPALASLVSRRPLAFGLHLSAVLLTGTRGALLCLVVGIAGHLLLNATRKQSTRARRFAPVAGVVAVGALVWLSPVSTALKERFDSPTMRSAAVETGLDVLRRNPVIGVGFSGQDANRTAVAEDWTMPGQTANGLGRAANQYVQTGVDGGVAALLLLLLFVIYSIRNAVRVIRWREATPLLVASQLWLIAMFVGNQGSPWLLSNAVSGFFTFAIAGLAAQASVLAAGDRT